MNVKLIRDFGIRALLSVLLILGLYEAVTFGFLLVWTGKVTVSFSDLLGLIAIAQAPVTMAVAFYFGFRMGENHGPPGEKP